MKKIGITGGIGSGKSTVVRLIRFLGYPVYEADFEAKRLINEDVALKDKIVSLLGAEAYTESGYNRSYVARQVFNNRDLLQQLNSIVHPAVRAHFEAWCRRNAASDLVFQEAAILFESGGHTAFDATLLVTAPQDMRIQRVVKRDGLAPHQVEARISNQWSDKQKADLADFVLQCDGRHLVIPQVLAILKQL
ncbi:MULTISPECIES: dephospho-CoA kinase [unclassified Carboxylicivirga]|uniref:dephospho-CoA kinase n=1 Tax=Carboxylicivirga TaxID=1628153 RepID=UPI003D33E8AF